jgi:hypothetical protein
MTDVSVSLAEGSISEGYVLGGYVGIVLTQTFILAALVLAVRALHARPIPIMVLGVLVATSPILDERGFLGSMEVIGKGLQLAVVVGAIHLVLPLLRRSPAAPRASSSTTSPTDPDHSVGRPETTSRSRV